MGIGDILEPWQGLYSAIADTLFEFSGYLTTRVDGAQSAGATTLTVESTNQFPTSGTLVIGGEKVLYTGVTTTTFTGITDEDGVAGLPSDVRDRDPVTDYSRDLTQIDDLRASFLVATAEGRELDILGRNYGLTRPRGTSDAEWRALLQVMIFVEAQTVYACEQVLDVIWGSGNYTLYEDLESDMHTVYVSYPIGGGDTPLGKTWLVSGEEQSSLSGPNEVTVDYPADLAYGVWDASDPLREGTNYAYADITVASSAGAPQTLTSSGAFEADDEKKPITISNFGIDTYWVIYTFIDTSTVILRWFTRSDGIMDSGDPNEFRTEIDWFPAWLGESVVDAELVIESGDNAGTYSIQGRIDARTLQIAGPVTASTETEIDWHIRPELPNASGQNGNLHRASIGGIGNDIVSCPKTLTAPVLVDYTTTPSAQVVKQPSFDGNSQYPAYIWDEGAITQQVLDLLTAAGIRVVLVPE